MNETESIAMMFMALCKQGRAGEAWLLASEANFSDLIVGLNKMADACDSTPAGKNDREFILGMEHFLLDQIAGRPQFD